MSGLTSQPAMGAVVGSLAGGHLDTGVQLDDIAPLIDYWESTRVSYAAFESGQKSGSAEVYAHEIPGGRRPAYGKVQYRKEFCSLEACEQEQVGGSKAGI